MHDSLSRSSDSAFWRAKGESGADCAEASIPRTTSVTLAHTYTSARDDVFNACTRYGFGGVRRAPVQSTIDPQPLRD